MFSPGRVTYHHIMGAILLYLIIAVSFVPLFAFVGSLVPKAFSGITMQDDPALASNLIYFSFVTLTTTGYGDVFPVHPIARSLCNLEAVIGQLYPATLLARLVTLEMAHRTKAFERTGRGMRARDGLREYRFAKMKAAFN